MSEYPLSARIFNDNDQNPIDPYALFLEWLAQAHTSELNDPNAMAVASVDKSGMPDVRMVLLNQHDERGFVFFTNFGSEKGKQLLASKKAALLFHWKSLRRQIRIRGLVEQVSDAEADAYFNSRPLQSRIGSHASEQSRPLNSRQILEQRVEVLKQTFEDGDIERPEIWSGFRIIPTQIEFWSDGAFRLHDRIRFTKNKADENWISQRLFP